MPKRTHSRRQPEDQLALDLRVKRCRICAQDVAAWDFLTNKKSKDGLGSYCRPCWRIKQREYHKGWMEDPDFRARRRQKDRKWRRDNPELAKAIVRKHREAHKEKHRARAAQWREANREYHRALTEAWRKANPESARASASLRRARINAATVVPFTVEQLAERWAYYGNKCWACGGEATATMSGLCMYLLRATTHRSKLEIAGNSPTN